MRIEALSATTFRNLAQITIRPRAPTVVLTGDNGQGKTNILEALYLCATGRSFRRAPAQHMISLGQQHARCEALILRQEVRHTVGVTLAPQGVSQAPRQRLLVDGRALRQATQLLTLVNVVAFFPEDLRIAKGSPEERRRFFDRAVAGGDAAFVEATLSYHRALKERNALLRQPGRADARLIKGYDAQLVRYGAIMHARRMGLLATLWPLAQGFFSTLMGQHTLGLRLVSGVSAWDEAQARGDNASFEALFAQALDERLLHDRARRMTLTGPHRSDLYCAIDGQAARTHGSQGQQRALVLALKLAEMVALKARLETPPILLLDDVSSELDSCRTALLFELLGELGSQVWVTTTGSVPLPIKTPAHRLTVRDGKVTETLEN